MAANTIPYMNKIHEAFNPLVGKKLIGIDFMTLEDAKQLGWGRRAPVLVFEDGTTIFPMADAEGNDAGAFATTLSDAPTVASI